MTEPSQYFKGRTVQEQMNEVIGYVDTRSAEVAVNAIAADVAQVHQDMLDADADASAAAASAAAAAGTLANAVKKTGEASQSIAGDIAISGALSVSGAVTVPAPTGNTNAATKKYVDDADALKADKTYVDAQDALKVSITDINNYAVGLTGNQTKAGILKFAHSPPDSQMGLYEHGYSCTLTDVPSFTDTPAQTEIYDLVSVYANDGTFLNALRYVRSNDGKHSLEFVVHLQDDTNQFIRLAITS